MRVLLASLCLTLLAGVVPAQTDRGTITGAVKDPSDAVVAGATVMGKNLATGVENKTVTTHTGNYSLAGLSVGTYDVSVEANGFKKFLSRGVQVQLTRPRASM